MILIMMMFILILMMAILPSRAILSYLVNKYAEENPSKRSNSSYDYDVYDEGDDDDHCKENNDDVDYRFIPNRPRAESHGRSTLVLWQWDALQEHCRLLCKWYNDGEYVDDSHDDDDYYDVDDDM